MKNTDLILLGAAGVAAYFIFFKKQDSSLMKDLVGADVQTAANLPGQVVGGILGPAGDILGGFAQGVGSFFGGGDPQPVTNAPMQNASAPVLSEDARNQLSIAGYVLSHPTIHPATTYEVAKAIVTGQPVPNFSSQTAGKAIYVGPAAPVSKSNYHAPPQVAQAFPASFQSSPFRSPLASYETRSPFASYETSAPSSKQVSRVSSPTTTYFYRKNNHGFLVRIGRSYDQTTGRFREFVA